MRVRSLLPLLGILIGACSSSPADAGLCTFAARVNDAMYILDGTVSADRVGPEFTRTLRQRDCVDGDTDSVAWQNGDSSFAAGTPLHASVGQPTSEVLLAPLPDGRWLELRAAVSD